MSYELLLSRIDDRLRALKLSERKACMEARIGLKSIYHIRERGHAPKAKTLSALAGVLKVPPEYLLDAAADIAFTLANNKLVRVYVVGSVRAGQWQTALERDADDWYTLTVPTDERYPNVRQFGLEVRGSSMDLVYPEGTVVLVVPFADLSRPPASGERVIVLLRSRDSDEFEATVKEYQVDDRGRHILWPRSSDPEYQTPFILSDGDLPPTTSEAWTTPDWNAETEAQAGGHAGNVLITALVIGSYRRE